MKNKNLEKTQIAYIVVITLFIGLFVGYSLVGAKNRDSKTQDTQITKSTCLADDCLLVDDLEYPVGTLPTEVRKALDAAIDDEYKALSVYEAVIYKFGTVRPFSMIRGAEEQHIASLKAIYDKYGLPTPKNNWTGKITVPKTITESCQIGVEAEIANAALYRDTLLPSVSAYPDIQQVFVNLMNASEQKHLSAFERCN
ncbi:MAG TPA: hypothetical protein VN174_02885 [Candidatus Methanoperedens sp.]|nr:hypothetical protein [Candidatus Methanoperedens sp.]